MEATSEEKPRRKYYWETYRVGVKPVFASPEVLWNACVEYFLWVEANPLYEVKGFAYEGEVTEHEFPKIRAMTVGGLCAFIGLSEKGWHDYRDKPDFADVCDMVDSVIRAQKFEGAAAGLLNPVIIARDLGLTERNEHSGPGGGPISTVTEITHTVVDPQIRET